MVLYSTFGFKWVRIVFPQKSKNPFAAADASGCFLERVDVGRHRIVEPEDVQDQNRPGGDPLSIRYRRKSFATMLRTANGATRSLD